MSKIKLSANYWKFLFIVVLFATALFTRVFQLNKLPPSLYWEEVALAFDGYSIFKTGKDHHGNTWPIIAFESFGDWKPSGYFYAVAPFVGLLGLSETAVRLPAALSGIGLVFTIAYSTKIIFLLTQKNHNQPKTIQKSWLVFFFAGFISTLSPWGIIFSRAAWEVNFATFLMTLSLMLSFVLFYKLKKHSLKVSVKTQLIFLLLIEILLISTMYTYHAFRVISPLLGLGIFYIYIKSVLLKTNKKTKQRLLFTTLIMVIIGLVLTLPIIKSLSSKEIGQRFTETSIFTDITIIEKSNKMKEVDSSFISNISSHRYILFSKEIIKNYFSHFSFSFLFLNGDSNPRHSVQFFGQLYYLDVILIALGLVFIIKNWNKYLALIIGLILIGVLPSSISIGSPHALRTLPIWPSLMIIASLGFLELVLITKQIVFKKTSLQKLLIIFFIVIYLIQFFIFWRFYSEVYSAQQKHEWQFGYKEMIYEINNLMKDNPESPVYISRKGGRPAMYYWFYTNTDPKEVQKISPIVKKDQSEFLEFDRIKFEEFDKTSHIFNNNNNQKTIVADYINQTWKINIY